MGCAPAIAQTDAVGDLADSLQWRSSLESRHELLADERPSLAPGGAGLAQRELSQVDVTLWASRGRAALGVGVGALSDTLLAPAQGREPARPLAQQISPALTVGWRMQLGENSLVYADTSTAPGFVGEDGERRAYYSTRGGIEWKLSESRMGFDRGRLSMRLDSGYRMSLRVRGGGIGVMLRGQF